MASGASLCSSIQQKNVAQKRVAVFSIGVPDPSQGGSGIFNYYLVRELLNCGYAVEAYLRVSDDFRRNHTLDAYLEALVAKGLHVEFIAEPQPNTRGLFGAQLLWAAHNVYLCEDTVKRVLCGAKKYEAIIAHELGWALALALAGAEVPVVGIIGDPLHSRLIHGQPLEWLRPMTWWRHVRARAAGTQQVFNAIGARTNGKLLLGSFSPHHAREFREKGVECTDFRWFSPEVELPPPRKGGAPTDKPLVLLHVGTLASTASYSMLQYWHEQLLPELAGLPFPVEIRFVGRIESTFSPPPGNLTVTFLGHEGDLYAEFANCDAFFSPMKYPVGTRTRILSAMAYAVPTIADPSASLGLPELQHMRHAFFGGTAKEIGEIVSLIRNDRKIANDVGQNGRKLWEEKFHPTTNVTAILKAAELA